MPAGRCLMRSSDPTQFALWYGWNGANFSVQFVDPYKPFRAEPEKHTCQTLATLKFTVLDLKWSEHFQRYIAGGESPKYYVYALSDDLITWEKPVVLRVKLAKG